MTDRPELPKPFVMWMGVSASKGEASSAYACSGPRGVYTQRVVITPVYDDDPVPGEVWVMATGRNVTIRDTPRADLTGQGRYVGTSHGVRVGLDTLTRPPALKTYRLPETIQAESREAALEALRTALVEVET